MHISYNININTTKFDNDGNLLQWDGQPILLNGSVPRDPEILDVLEIYRPQIEALRDEVIGVSKVKLHLIIALETLIFLYFQN